MSKAGDMLSKAKARLSLTQPFFSVMLFKHQLIETDALPTMGVNGYGTMYYNPKFVESLTIDEVTFLLCHEVMHVVYSHVLRMGNRNKELWNIAGDAVINETLKAMGIGKPIEGGIYMEGAEERTTEDVYNELLKKQKDKPQLPKEFKDLIEGGDSSGLGGKPLSESEKRSLDARIQGDVAEASNVQKSSNKGKLAGGLQRYIDEILAGKKLPWYEMLARYMTSLAEQNFSWKRPNKRYSSYYLPTSERIPGMGELVVGIDTSGSITDKELAMFGAHIKDLCQQVHPMKIYVLYVDAEVNHVDEFDDVEELEFRPYGGGGTDLREIANWIDREGIDADACVIFTDGYTDYPEEEPCPTWWVLTTNVKVPEHIKHIRFEEDK